MKFEIGEIALVTNSRSGNNDSECEIISELINYDGFEGYNVVVEGRYCHKLDSQSGEWFALPSQLRKKKPPEASWEEIQKSIGWNPTKEEVTHG